jgi:hypothetical protein
MDQQPQQHLRVRDVILGSGRSKRGADAGAGGRMNGKDGPPGPIENIGAKGPWLVSSARATGRPAKRCSRLPSQARTDSAECFKVRVSVAPEAMSFKARACSASPQSKPMRAANGYTLLVENCRLVAPTQFDSSEDIITRLVPVSEIPNLVATGKIRHSLVIAALYHYQLSVGRDSSHL